MKYILKVDCADEKGLIYRICDVIFKHDLNISTNHEFVDKEYQLFFFRASIISDESVDERSVVGTLRAVLPSGANISFEAARPKNIAILCTKEAHCLGDLLIKYSAGELGANIACVISNHENLRALVERFDLPYVCIESDGMDRDAHEKAVLAELSRHELDAVVMAKYMRILSPEFIAHYPHRIINIHHSFLPAFIGSNPYKQAHARGVKIIGATAHFATNNLDEGPIIAQDVVRVGHEMSWEDMREAGRYIEKNVLTSAIDLFLKDRIFVYGNKTVVF